MKKLMKIKKSKQYQADPFNFQNRHLSTRIYVILQFGIWLKCKLLYGHIETIKVKTKCCKSDVQCTFICI